jgi:hypothetical protein
MRGIALAIMFAGWTIGTLRASEKLDAATSKLAGTGAGILGLSALICIFLGI